MYNTWGMDTCGDTLSGNNFSYRNCWQLLHSSMSQLYDAAKEGDLERVQVLMEQGADKDRGVPWGETPLCAASHYGHLAVVRYLVDQGADMEKAIGSWTPLIAASCNGHLEVVRYLLEQGANKDEATDHGWTSLHIAAQFGDPEIAKLLMMYGADLIASNKWGKLPINMTANEEIRQAIRDEPERRRDQQPRKRCIEDDRYPNAAAASASAQQEDDDDDEKQINKQPAEGEGEEGKEADEDQDSEPSSDEDDN